MSVKHECFNCEDVLDKCGCGDTETVNADGPVCPHCGYLHNGFKSSDGRADIKCIGCRGIISTECGDMGGGLIWMSWKGEGK